MESRVSRLSPARKTRLSARYCSRRLITLPSSVTSSKVAVDFQFAEILWGICIAIGPAPVPWMRHKVLRPLWVAFGVSGGIVGIIETCKPVMLPHGGKGNA